MTSLPDWAERGRELGATLDACHAIVVAGADPVATAEVALGIARVQAAHRRVAVADLIGEAPPLQSLVTGDDPHGIVDSFLFGVSLNRVAHAVPDLRSPGTPLSCPAFWDGLPHRSDALPDLRR